MEVWCFHRRHRQRMLLQHSNQDHHTLICCSNNKISIYTWQLRQLLESQIFDRIPSHPRDQVIVAVYRVIMACHHTTPVAQAVVAIVVVRWVQNAWFVIKYFQTSPSWSITWSNIRWRTARNPLHVTYVPNPSYKVTIWPLTCGYTTMRRTTSAPTAAKSSHNQTTWKRIKGK